MKRFQLFRIVLRRSGVNKVAIGFLATYAVCALVVLIAEPGVETYGDALWFLWALFWGEVALRLLLDEGIPVAAAARLAARISGGSRSALYAVALRWREENAEDGADVSRET